MPDANANGVTTLEATTERVPRRRVWGQRLSVVVAGLALAAIAIVFADYMVAIWAPDESGGSESRGLVVNEFSGVQTAAFLAIGFFVLGIALLFLSYFRRTDDFLDKLLHDTGNAVLTGAVLSLGFSVLVQYQEQQQRDEDAKAATELRNAEATEEAERQARLEEEQAIQDEAARKRDLMNQVRDDAGGRSYSQVDLSGEMLIGLEMVDFVMPAVNLRNAHLGGSNLSRSDLQYARMNPVFASGTRFLGTNLSGANMRTSDLAFTDFGSAKGNDGSAEPAILIGTILEGAFLESANLTDISGFRAHMARSHLANAILVGAELSQADLRDAILSGADVTGADLSMVDFEGARLDGVDLSAAKTLAGADFTDVHCDGTTTWPSDIQEPDCVDPAQYRNPYQDLHESYFLPGGGLGDPPSGGGLADR